MRVRKDVFTWIRDCGAEALSLDSSYRRSREMASTIYAVHVHVWYMRKFVDKDEDKYQYHMSQCQDALARIEFLCALNGNDTKSDELASLFTKMTNHELSTASVFGGLSDLS